ncbi:MAG: SlyX family protein [Alphaproteobacteria bacterium]|nr:SlyX family protein [Alphaproteobacteria bacterium]
MTDIDMTQERIDSLEIDLLHQQKMLNDLNEELVKQWKIIDRLVLENKELKKALGSNIRPLSEETPPPHY